MKYRKKLIEVALPLEAINVACTREKSIRYGHPSTLHLWWARRPLAAARAIIFAQMVDDPSEHPERFPTQKDQSLERQRLFELIEKLVSWENISNQELLNEAFKEIKLSWELACLDNCSHPNVDELFDASKIPAFHDPFAGGGALPLEAQRLGLESYASDLNPVAVLINKAMIEIPPKFSGLKPVNPEVQKKKDLFEKEWVGTSGMCEDIMYYGQWMLDKAEQRIGSYYPQVKITEKMAKDRPDLKPLVGSQLKVIAWLWTRTVASPNPAFASVNVPLIASFCLSQKKNKETWIEPVIDKSNKKYSFRVRIGGKPKFEETINRRGGICIMSDSPIPFDYIRNEAKSGRLNTRLLAIVAESNNGRIYLDPIEDHEKAAYMNLQNDIANVSLPQKALGFRVQEYGMLQWKDLFTNRQQLALKTFSDLIQEVRNQIILDSRSFSGFNYGTVPGLDIETYADAIVTYLAFAIDKGANYWSSLCSWHGGRETITSTFGRQTLPMVWDFTEANPFSNSSGNFSSGVVQSLHFLNKLTKGKSSKAFQAAAQSQTISDLKIISTDPPYYDNIGYADLSDFFYFWLRRSLGHIYPALFATMSVPKAEELIATPYRHGGKEQAERFFMSGMTEAMRNLAEKSHPAFPVTIYYAFKQTETNKDKEISSTGWETFLEAIHLSGFSITGTWPLRTEYTGNLKKNVGALASSIVLVCKKRADNATVATRRDFLKELKTELPKALKLLQQGNIAPVDLQQAAIGPGIAVFTRFEKVLDSNGHPLPVKEALILVNQILDETLAEKEGDFDPETRWALTWFEQFGFDEGEFGIAETLSKAKNTSVAGIVALGIAISKSGKVRLLSPFELSNNGSPNSFDNPTVWEMVHFLVGALDEGETKAAKILEQLGSKADVARDLAYRLFSICERKKRAQDALGYNSLVQSWPELKRLARDQKKVSEKQTLLFT